ncbi:hypothetical protein OG613_49210 (plasmid) [Streptomyces sp. NBC_00015]|uniref:hypothetical protein n=1 Tax=Streptomyces sp. NBC_00015 TaxID=2903611 RepID=UPI002F9096EB
MPSNVRRRLATLTTAAAVLVGAAAIAAPNASAVGSSACRYNVTRDTSTVTANGVNFRTGPGTGYAAKGLLYKGDTFVVHCGVLKGTVAHRQAWLYSKLLHRSKSRLPAGTWGWVRDGFAVSG